jgi:hydrogenase/urease accessory protein HupE
MTQRRAIACAGVFAAVFMPAAAHAHLVNTGMGPLYDGIDHFGLSPEDYLPVVALAFFAGLRGAAHSRLALAAVTACWIMGGVAALSGVKLPSIASSSLTAALLLSVGALLASDRDCPAVLCAAVAAALGLVRGSADMAGASANLADTVTLIGMAASAFAVFALAASITLPLTRFWMIASVRVGGSWIAALGLLLAGWIWRYGTRIT